jgi:transcriptional regulator with XRE-family HTH domain
MLPHRLKAARLKAGLSQERLGILAGIDEATASARMNQYERGIHTPDFELTCRLASVMEIPACYFWRWRTIWRRSYWNMRIVVSPGSNRYLYPYRISSFAMSHIPDCSRIKRLNIDILINFLPMNSPTCIKDEALSVLLSRVQGVGSFGDGYLAVLSFSLNV